MNPDRRAFLGHAALAAAGLSGLRAATPSVPAAEATPWPEFDARDPERFWVALKAQYLLDPGFTYFNTGGLGPAMRPVIETAERWTRELQRTSEHGHERLGPPRAAVAAYLCAKPEEIAFVRNATEANSIVAAGLGLQAGDEIILDSHAHPGGSFVWFLQAQQRGVVVKLFDPDPAGAAANIARIAALLTPRTRLVQVSHVTAPTGILLPVAAIARLCRERGIWFHVDGAQSAGMVPFSLAEIGADSFATSGHKWIGAPIETGVLQVRHDRLDGIRPLLVGSYSGELPFLPGQLRLASTAVRFEYGTRSVPAVLALAEAMARQERIGRDRIAARGRDLSRRMREGLREVPDTEILTPANPADSGAILTFRNARIGYEALFKALLRDHRFRCRPVSEQHLNAVRISPHLCTTAEDCDRLVAAIHRVVRAA